MREGKLLVLNSTVSSTASTSTCKQHSSPAFSHIRSEGLHYPCRNLPIFFPFAVHHIYSSSFANIAFHGNPLVHVAAGYLRTARSVNDAGMTAAMLLLVVESVAPPRGRVCTLLLGFSAVFMVSIYLQTRLLASNLYSFNA